MTARTQPKESAESAAEPMAAVRGRPAPASVYGGEAAVTSPAQQLQRTLEAEFTQSGEQKWSYAASVAFAAAASAGLWVLIVLAASAL